MSPMGKADSIGFLVMVMSRLAFPAPVALHGRKSRPPRLALGGRFRQWTYGPPGVRKDLRRRLVPSIRSSGCERDTLSPARKPNNSAAVAKYALDRTRLMTEANKTAACAKKKT